LGVMGLGAVAMALVYKRISASGSGQ